MAQGAKLPRSEYRKYSQGKRQSHGPKLVSARRVTAKIDGTPERGAGSAQRGVGTRSRDATVEPITGASLRCRSHARLRGQIPKGTLFRPPTRPACADATAKACVRPAHDGVPPVPLRGRIQAQSAWNLLRPARDTLSGDLAIFAICPASSFASSPILARNAHVFHYVTDSKQLWIHRGLLCEFARSRARR